MQENIETKDYTNEKYVLDNITNNLYKADSKASIALAILGVLIPMILKFCYENLEVLRFDNNIGFNTLKTIIGVLLGFGLAFIINSFIWFCSTIRPRFDGDNKKTIRLDKIHLIWLQSLIMTYLKKKKKNNEERNQLEDPESLIYYENIKDYRVEEYIKKFTSKDDLSNDILLEAYQNSKICSVKMHKIKAGIDSILLSVVLLGVAFIFFVILYYQTKHIPNIPLQV